MAGSEGGKRAPWYVGGAAVLAILGVIADVGGAWSFGRELFSGAGPTAQTAMQKLESPSVSTSLTPQNPVQAPVETAVPSKTPVQQAPGPVPPQNTPRPRGPLLISFAFADGLAVGKDKARACTRTTQTFCVIVKDSVSNESGRINSGCNLSWRLYPAAAQTPVEQGSVPCNSFSGIRLGVKKAMPAGDYRLDAAVELNDGFTGSGVYAFSMVD